MVFDKKVSHSGIPIRLPCYQCSGCRLERSRVWAVRCMNEKRMHKESCFLTLTYSNENVPLLQGPAIQHAQTLSLRDLQLFMKRLRKKRGTGIRFFACGEYGPSTLRPHYHILLFNVDFSDRRFFQNNRRGEPLFTSEQLRVLWPNGHSVVGDVTFDSCAYVARYIMDKITGDIAPGFYKGRLPEFTTKSLKPGLGHDYYMKYAHEIYAHDSLIVNGKKVKPPRFYDERYAMLDRTGMEELKEFRRRHAIERSRADSTPERRRTKEVFQELVMARFKRSLE